MITVRSAMNQKPPDCAWGTELYLRFISRNMNLYCDLAIDQTVIWSGFICRNRRLESYTTISPSGSSTLSICRARITGRASATDSTRLCRRRKRCEHELHQKAATKRTLHR